MIKKALKRVVRPIEVFLQLEAASGIILLICTVVALAIANSPLLSVYHGVLHFHFAGLSIHEWINDGLMTIFFFVVGMEIKREMVKGELATAKKAALPLAAAFGGMVVPAIVYYTFNPIYPDIKGWGIPMATDIAFAVGVLTLFGKRVPFSLKIFLLALAIVDDLGAVLVIAFFYTKTISGMALGIAAILFFSVVLLQKAGIQSKLYYLLVGALAWLAILKSGVHATIAGVIIGFLTPVKPFAEEQKAPLDELVTMLHPWVSYFIMPIFALSNAGVALVGADVGALMSTGIFKGVFGGLLFGKPIGIFVAAWLAVKLKIASLPSGVTWPQIFGLGILGGIGFTMALFIGGLALYPEQVDTAKLGILMASLCASLAGLLVMHLALHKRAASGDSNEAVTI